MSAIRVGDEVHHPTHGYGLVTEVKEGNSAGLYTTVFFYLENDMDSPSRTRACDASKLTVVD